MLLVIALSSSWLLGDAFALSTHAIDTVLGFFESKFLLIESFLQVFRLRDKVNFHGSLRLSHGQILLQVVEELRVVCFLLSLLIIRGLFLGFLGLLLRRLDRSSWAAHFDQQRPCWADIIPVNKFFNSKWVLARKNELFVSI